MDGEKLMRSISEEEDESTELQEIKRLIASCQFSAHSLFFFCQAIKEGEKREYAKNIICLFDYILSLNIVTCV